MTVVAWGEPNILYAYNEGTMKEFIAEYSFYFYSSLAMRIKRDLEYEQMLFLKIIKVFQSIQS